MRADSSTSYTGRFAPSPSGELHFGSLIAALASFLDARAHQGHWLVRMEDIDTPRCVEGADEAILSSLKAHGLHWDGDVLYQSRCHPRYQQRIDQWLDDAEAYFCECTRRQIRETGGRYAGTCRYKSLSPENTATRLALTNDNTPPSAPVLCFDDIFLGQQVADPDVLEDIIIKRRDTLFAYNLVVVLDDIFQGVTHIIRGADLLPTTFVHRALYEKIGAPIPAYGHVPVAATKPGFKLSKQNKAKALNNQTPQKNLLDALLFLGQPAPRHWQDLCVEQLLDKAVSLWDRKKVPNTPEIVVHSNESTYHSGL